MCSEMGMAYNADEMMIYTVGQVKLKTAPGILIIFIFVL